MEDNNQPTAVLKHIPTLDGVRGLAIALVLLHHFTQAIKPRHWGDHLFYLPGHIGWTGVDLFFVLSGFLVTTILIRTKERAHYFSNFYSRRFLRIFPLYYGVLFFYFVILSSLPISFPEGLFDHQLWFWLYGANFYTAIEGWPVRPLAHFWSLAIELQFYLIWPIVIYFIRQQWLVWIMIALISISVISRGVLAYQDYAAHVMYSLTFCRMDAMVVGAMLAYFCLRHYHSAQFEQILKRLLFVSALLVLIVLATSQSLDWREWGIFSQATGYTLIALFFGCFTGLGILAKPQTLFYRCLSSKTLRFLGKYSYGIYVLHVFFDAVARMYEWHPSGHERFQDHLILWSLLYITVLSVISIGVAYLSWHAYEKQFLKLKKFVSYK